VAITTDIKDEREPVSVTQAYPDQPQSASDGGPSSWVTTAAAVSISIEHQLSSKVGAAERERTETQEPASLGIELGLWQQMVDL
jgi:hypothetical protein